jgi:hypothetical protein
LKTFVTSFAWDAALPAQTSSAAATRPRQTPLRLNARHAQGSQRSKAKLNHNAQKSMAAL